MPKARAFFIFLVTAIMLVPDMAFATQKGVSLRVLSVDQPAIAACLEEAGNEFEKLTGIAVEINTASSSRLYNAARNDFVAGTGEYDIITLSAGWMSEFADSRYLTPLGSYIASDPETNYAAMFDRVLELYGQWNGEQYGIPFSAEVMLLFIRADVLEAAGVEIPDTWEAFQEAVEAVHADTEAAGAAVIDSVAAGQWANRYWGMGGGAFEAKSSEDMAFDPEIAAAALQMLGAYPRLSLPAALEQFIDGELAMLEGWPSEIGPVLFEQMDGEALDQVLVVPVPGRVAQSTGWGLSVSASSLNQDVAYRFISLATSDAYDVGCTSQGKHPVTADAYRSLAGEPAFFWYDVQAAAFSRSNALVRAPQATRLQSMFIDEIMVFLDGDRDAEETAAELQRQIDSILY